MLFYLASPWALNPGAAFIIALVSPQIPRAAGPLIRPAPFRNIPGSPVAGTREPVILFLTEEAACMLVRPLHIKLKELRDERSYIGHSSSVLSIEQLAKYLQDHHKHDNHILKDRKFCHDALIYWWYKAYDTMELYATDGYWASIFDVWLHQKLYLRCVVNECEGYWKGVRYGCNE